nr:MAG TPA: hypothetical protein [Caudoviricetes sp.]
MSILGSMSDALRKQPKAPTISPTPEKDNSQTMAGNVANILNGNSLLMNSAAAKGERIAANRGLQNSTIGAEAAQRAMLDAAIPIASQDTQHQFAASQANLDRGHQKDLAKLQADLSYSNQSRLNQEQNRFAASQADLDRGHQRGLAQLQADLSYKNQSRLNQEQNRFTASQAGLDREHQRGLAQLQADLSYKNQSRLNDTQNRFAASQAGLDREHQTGLAKLQADLNFNNQSRLNKAQNDFAASQAGLDRAHQLGLTRLQSDLNYNNQSRLTKLQSDLNYNNQSRLNQAQYNFTASQNALDRSNQRELANLNHQNEMRNLNAQVSANTIGKSIDFTMQIANNFDAQIAGILNNTNMKAEDKEKAINTLKSSRDSEINFVSKFMQGIPTTKQNWSSFPSLGVPSIGIK